jgi:hypothetical protein
VFASELTFSTSLISVPMVVFLKMVLYSKNVFALVNEPAFITLAYEFSELQLVFFGPMIFVLMFRR